MTVHRSVEAAETAVIAEAALLNSGSMKIYSGTKPATVATALSGNTLLVSCALGASATAGASDGLVTLTISSGTAVGDGTASFARFFKSDGTTAVYDADVTITAGVGPIKIDSLTIAIGDTVNASGTISMPLL